jgi:hypothetical protein
MNCCDDTPAGIECNQGRDCPIRRQITDSGGIQRDAVGGLLLASVMFCLVMLVLALL